MKYRPAKNFPLDLYYLMDLTLTMQHDVQTMATLGVELTDVLQQLTPHYQLAFGYYSDKVAIPFSNMAYANAENPCVSFNEKCRKPFDFIHALNFTKNIEEFIQKVRTCLHTTFNLTHFYLNLCRLILAKRPLTWTTSKVV